MNRLALLLSGILCIGTAQAEMTKTKYCYTFTSIVQNHSANGDALYFTQINGRRVYCSCCGKDPVMVMIVFGSVQGFCYIHLPIIDIQNGSNCCEDYCE